MRLATGGIIKEWVPLWEDDPASAIIPLGAIDDQVVEGWLRSPDRQIVANVTIEVKPCE